MEPEEVAIGQTAQIDVQPIITDEKGEWYSIIGITVKAKRTPERIRQLSVMKDPAIIKDKSRGVILFRLADGWEFLEKGGIRRKA